MSEWKSPLHDALHRRAEEADREDLLAVISYLTTQRPTAVVAAFEYATRLREEVEETLRR